MSFDWFRRLFAAPADASSPADPLAGQSFIALEPDLAKELRPHELSGYLASGSSD